MFLWIISVDISVPIRCYKRLSPLLLVSTMGAGGMTTPVYYLSTTSHLIETKIRYIMD